MAAPGLRFQTIQIENRAPMEAGPSDSTGGLPIGGAVGHWRAGRGRSSGVVAGEAPAGGDDARRGTLGP